MLLQTLKNGAQALLGLFLPRDRETRTLPLDEEERLNRLHAGAGTERHQDILFEGVGVGGENFAALYRRCLTATGTSLTPANALRRFQGRFSLVQYFLHSLPAAGARAEVGVYRGATALLLAHVARARDPGFRGRGFYLIDSYQGTSESGAADLIPVRDSDGTARMRPFFPAGKSDTSAELVRGFFREFPEAEVVQGWIPDVFSKLPETPWAFIHLDVTLHAPTAAALEYFHPRLARGGVIVVDGYGSPFCPGLKQAWDGYCERNGVDYAVLAQQQAVMIRP